MKRIVGGEGEGRLRDKQQTIGGRERRWGHIWVDRSNTRSTNNADTTQQLHKFTNGIQTKCTTTKQTASKPPLAYV